MMKMIPLIDISPSNINFSINNQEKNKKISKNLSKAIKFINKRFRKGILTTSSDLLQFVKSKKDKKAAIRKLAQRLVNSGAAERLDNGVYIPAGFSKYIKDTDIKTLAKIKSKRQRNSILKTQTNFLDIVKPIVCNNQNKWSLSLTHLTVKFNVNGLYEKIKEINIVEKHDKYYLLSFQPQDFPYLKAAFHIYRNKVILKLGNPDYPLHASENIILTAILICRKYLIHTIKFWNFNLVIPQAHEWKINIPSIYTITINPDYTKFGKSIKNKTLGYELADNGNCLLLKQKLYLYNLKPSQLIGLPNKYYPLNILNLAPLKFSQNPSANVTLSNEHENNNFSKSFGKCHAFKKKFYGE